MSSVVVKLHEFKDDLLKWSKAAIIAGTPKLAYFTYTDKNLFIEYPRMRIGYTPKPLIYKEKEPSPDALKSKAKYTLPLVTTEDVMLNVQGMEESICRLIYERKDSLLSASDARKCSGVASVMDYYFKSTLYFSEDRVSGTPLMNVKIPLDHRNEHSNEFAVVCHVIHTISEEEKQSERIILDVDNYVNYIKGGAEVMVIARLKGVVVANGKVFPMVDVAQMVIFPREMTPEEDPLNATFDYDTLLLSALGLEPPKLLRETNQMMEEEEDQTISKKRSRKEKIN